MEVMTQPQKARFGKTKTQQPRATAAQGKTARVPAGSSHRLRVHGGKGARPLEKQGIARLLSAVKKTN
jgi:hypothetical protein